MRSALRLAILRAIGPTLGRASLRQCAELSDRPPRLLLIRPDHLGDLLLAAPAGLALRRALPNARIDWLVGSWGAEAISRAPHADTVMTCDFPGFTRRPKRSFLSPYVEVARQARTLRAQAYDVALILRSDHWWGAMLAAAAGVPRRIGYMVPEVHPFLTHSVPLPSATHVLELGVSLARVALHIFDPTAALAEIGPSFSIGSVERARAWELLALSDVQSDAAFVAVHPGSGSALKNWLPDRWSAICTSLQALGMKVVLTGGETEAALLEAVAAGCNPRPLVLAGKTELGQLGALFERCEMVLGGDSGPLHLAAAVNTRTLRIYGPTDPAMYGPIGREARHAVITAKLPCQPCGNIVSPPCGALTTPACLRVISADRVIEQALRGLSTSESPPALSPHPC